MTIDGFVGMFPSPCEVYRVISLREKYEAQANREFPSPLEVNRFISKYDLNVTGQNLGSRPLSRYIGLYQ